MEEIWKDIEGYDGKYQISNFGRVRSFNRYKIGKIIHISLNNHGYYTVRLIKNKKQYHPATHLLVWDHFGSSKRDGRLLQVDHVNNDKTNNRIDNLQLLSGRENCSKSKLRNKKTSKYTGVSWDKRSSKWRSQIQIKGKDINIGSFIIEEDAHIAYQSALIRIKNNNNGYEKD